MTYNLGQHGVLKFGLEAGMIAAGASALGAAPALGIAGYGNLPGMTRSEGVQVIDSVGSAEGVDTVPGNRESGSKVSLKIGNAEFLRYGLRSSGITPNFKCLPVLSLASGATDACGDGSGFSWLLRYALINSFTLNYNESQPVMADVDFMGVAMDPDAAVQTMDFSALATPARSTLTWFHTSFIIGGFDYRNYLQSVSLTVSNNVVPVGGYRNDFGWNNPLSRTRQQLAPGKLTVQVSYRLHRQLSRTLIDAAITSGNWGSVILRASDKAVNPTNGKQMDVVIPNNMLSNLDLQSVEAGQPFGYNIQTTGRGCSINVS